MQKKLLHKLAAIALLSLLLLVPLGLVERQIAARSERQAIVINDIAASSARAQTLVGPLLLLRYRERVTYREKRGEHEAVTTEVVERSRVVPAQRLDIAGDLKVESLKRGIFRAQRYQLNARLNGSVELPVGLGLPADTLKNLVEARAWLVMGIADPRGLAENPELLVNGHKLGFVAGLEGAMPGLGLSASLGALDPVEAQRFEFSLPLLLTGTERLAFAPTANTTRVTLRSDWQHPSFQGRFLPVERQVDASGFVSNWRVTHLARNLDAILQGGSAHDANGETLGVALIDPVNVYLQAERAVKYGILFVALTFASFFILEVLRGLSIHLMQYLLVGLALAIFFLLLVALSEHVSFLAAYLVAAGACVILIGIYLAGALASRRQGLLFGGGLGVLYGVLYGVLLSEDNALLMGSLLLFVALATAMMTTRHIDWYRLAGTEK